MRSPSKCLYCQSLNHDKWIQFKDMFNDQYQLDHCKDCGLYFLSPQPTEKQLKRAYEESYYGEGDKKFNPLVERVVDLFRARNSKCFAKRIPKSARVLDIGCGNGSFLINLGKQCNASLHGLELPGKSADRAAKHDQIQLYQGELKRDTYEENYFDAIVLTHVFEHLPRPKETLEIIQKIIKVKGLLQIEIPNIDSWQARLFRGNWLHLDPPRHLHFFTPKKFKDELSTFGFECIEEHYFSPQFSPFGAQQSILNSLLPERELLYEHLKANREYTAEYSSFHLFCQQVFHWLSFPFFVLTDSIASAFSKGATVKLVFRKQ